MFHQKIKLPHLILSEDEIIIDLDEVNNILTAINENIKS
jgi:hypothetical protein